MKKKLLAALAVSTVMISSVNTFAATNITLYVNNKLINTDVAPELKSNSTYVPLSFIAKELGAKVNWQSPKVTVEKDGVVLVFEMDKLSFKRDNEVQYLTTPPYLKNGRVMVPLRVISEQLGCKVDFNDKKEVRVESGNGTATNPNTSSTIDLNTYTKSPNGKFAFKIDRVYGEGIPRTDVLRIYNTETKELEEFYSSTTVMSAEWAKDGTLILSGNRDLAGKDTEKHVTIYDFDTNKAVVLDDIQYGYRYLPELEAIAYNQYLPGDDKTLVGNNCKLYDLKTGKTTNITTEQYSKYTN